MTERHILRRSVWHGNPNHNGLRACLRRQGRFRWRCYFRPAHLLLKRLFRCRTQL